MSEPEVFGRLILLLEPNLVNIVAVAPLLSKNEEGITKRSIFAIVLHV